MKEEKFAAGYDIFTCGVVGICDVEQEGDIAGRDGDCGTGRDDPNCVNVNGVVEQWRKW